MCMDGTIGIWKLEHTWLPPNSTISFEVEYASWKITDDARITFGVRCQMIAASASGNVRVWSLTDSPNGAVILLTSSGCSMVISPAKWSINSLHDTATISCLHFSTASSARTRRIKTLQSDKLLVFYATQGLLSVEAPAYIILIHSLHRRLEFDVHSGCITGRYPFGSVMLVTCPSDTCEIKAEQYV